MGAWSENGVSGRTWQSKQPVIDEDSIGFPIGSSLQGTTPTAESEECRNAKNKYERKGGVPEPDSSRGLGQTVGRRPPIKPDCGAADRSGKKATRDARHRRSHVKQAVAFWRKMPWWQRGKHRFWERRSETDQNVGYENWLKGGHRSTPEARLHGLEQTSPLVLAIQPHEENESSNCPSSGWVNSSFRQQHETMGHDEHKKTAEHGW